MPDIGDELWAWQVEEQPDVWGVVGAMVNDSGQIVHTPLVHRKREVVEKLMEPLARSHAEKTGQTLRLAHFKIVSA